MKALVECEVRLPLTTAEVLAHLVVQCQHGGYALLRGTAGLTRRKLLQQRDHPQHVLCILG